MVGAVRKGRDVGGARVLREEQVRLFGFFRSA